MNFVVKAVKLYFLPFSSHSPTILHIFIKKMYQYIIVITKRLIFLRFVDFGADFFKTNFNAFTAILLSFIFFAIFSAVKILGKVDLYSEHPPQFLEFFKAGFRVETLTLIVLKIIDCSLMIFSIKLIFW